MQAGHHCGEPAKGMVGPRHLEVNHPHSVKDPEMGGQEERVFSTCCNWAESGEDVLVIDAGFEVCAHDWAHFWHVFVRPSG